MPTRYIKGSGSNTSPYDTWAKGAPLLSTVAAVMAAGDVSYVSNSSAPTTVTVSTNYTFPSTPNNLPQLIGGDDAAEPPTAEAQATLTQTIAAGTSRTSFIGSVAVRKMLFVMNSTAPGWDGIFRCVPTTATNQQVYESCKWDFSGINTASSQVEINFTNNAGGGASNIGVEWHNCDVTLSSHANSRFLLVNRFVWNGGTLTMGATKPASLFNVADPGWTRVRDVELLVRNVDLSSHTGAGKNLVDPSMNHNSQRFTFDTCKLGATLGILNAAIEARNSAEVRIRNCDSGATNYRNEFYCYEGSHVTVVDNYLTSGGAAGEKADGTAGTVPISWKIVTLAPGPSFYNPFRTEPISKFNTVIGSSKTITVEGLINTTLPNDDEIWMEVSYMGTVGSPVGAVSRADRFANCSGAGAAQEAGAGDGAWTTTLGTPKSFKLTAAITPRQVGYISVRVCCGVASKTFYINPDFTIA